MSTSLVDEIAASVARLVALEEANAAHLAEVAERLRGDQAAEATIRASDGEALDPPRVVWQAFDNVPAIVELAEAASMLAEWAPKMLPLVQQGEFAGAAALAAQMRRSLVGDGRTLSEGVTYQHRGWEVGPDKPISERQVIFMPLFLIRRLSALCRAGDAVGRGNEDDVIEWVWLHGPQLREPWPMGAPVEISGEERFLVVSWTPTEIELVSDDGLGLQVTDADIARRAPVRPG